MNKKTALVIAFNILSDELDDIKYDYGVEEAKEVPYYQEVEEARAIIKKMMEDM